MNEELMITKEDLVNWLNRPPSNDDLDLIGFITTRLENFYKLEQENKQLKELKYKFFDNSGDEESFTLEDYLEISNKLYDYEQENKQLTRDKNIMQNYLQLIIDIGYDYDGYNDADNLKSVIDELCKYALYGKKLDDKSIISSSCEQYYNILGEALGDKENE